MNRYLETYMKSNKGQMEKEAFDFLVTDLLAKNLRGNDKQRTLTAHNMEDMLKNQFVPSMFYLIMYAKSDKPETIGHNDFYDVCSLIFCTGVNDKFITGINFNFIPNDIRARVMDLITERQQKFYDEMETTNSKDVRANTPLGSLLISENGVSAFLSFMKAKTGVDLSKCVRTYNRSNIVNVRLIEYDEWGYIPYLSFKDSVRGANLANIQRDVIMGSDA
jgi:hypothetical protein